MNRSYRFNLQNFSENAGELRIFETSYIPDFVVNRVFYILAVPNGKSRADHTCMNSSIIFIAMAGSVQISVGSKGEKTTYLLDNKEAAVYVPPAS